MANVQYTINNSSGSNVTYQGQTIVAGGSYTPSAVNQNIFASDPGLIADILNNKVYITIGGNSLNADSAMRLLLVLNSTVLVGNSDLTRIGNVGDRLKVDTQITSVSGGLTPSYSSKLRFVDMNVLSGGVARNTTVTNAAWTTVFNYSGSGLIAGWLLNIETKDDWLIRFVVDGEEIFDSAGLKSRDLHTDNIYDLDVAGKTNSDVDEALGIFFGEHDRITFQGPLDIPIKYNSSVQVLIRRDVGTASKKFQAGLIVLTKET